MQITAAIITINRLTLAAFLVDTDQTYLEAGARLIFRAQRHFPTLPIILLSPRVGGFSRSFAHFDTTNLIKHITAPPAGAFLRLAPAHLQAPSLL